MRLLALTLLSLCALTAAEHKGQVKFGGLPVPGATVTATQGDRSLVAITDQQGNYSFADLPDGVWNFQVEMLGFGPIKQEVTITAGAGAPEWDLKMLPLDEIKASAAPPLPHTCKGLGSAAAQGFAAEYVAEVVQKQERRRHCGRVGEFTKQFPARGRERESKRRRSKPIERRRRNARQQRIRKSECERLEPARQ